MSNGMHLERRYRRLLAWYPKAFRREHEDEMLVVLMSGARNGRRRPGLADSADLIRNAIWMRMRPRWHAEVHAHILPVEIGAPIAAVVWIGLAWANGRGYGWARGLVAGLFGLTSVSLIAAFAQHAATYAPADLIAGCALWLVGLLTLLLIINPRSDRHYRQGPDRDGRTTPSAAGWPAAEHVLRAGGVASWN